MSDQGSASTVALTTRLRLHRREWRHAGRTYQVISLRPTDPVRYAVRVERHYTVVSSDLAGARLLGRLLWGLAYQRRPDTLLVLEPGRLVPDVEEGRPSPPVVFSVAARTVLTPVVARRLRAAHLWRSRPTGTVTWNTVGFPAALADLQRWYADRRAGVPLPDGYVPTWPTPHLHADASVVTLSAAPGLLRQWATTVGRAGGWWYGDESCTEPDWGVGFDVHAVRHFHRRVSAARRARAEVLAAPGLPTEPDLVAERVRAHIEVVAARRPGPWDFAPPPRPD
ncbi:hypothetical protein EV384_5017 [Micromonospora kangleipakensis]|uniref:Uncharacterized protein n=1 Tax=Micromonospora kangleipakensis TaxID=1077942 RepID=A0A4Q8BGL8_9ACTN|nr:hypothetical protein [Micromonospora kangleipakensis]RZU76369.1 hypothetical protein EV384_5017 [Micromonospora kangleipakensis]